MQNSLSLSLLRLFYGLAVLLLLRFGRERHIHFQHLFLRDMIQRVVLQRGPFAVLERLHNKSASQHWTRCATKWPTPESQYGFEDYWLSPLQLIPKQPRTRLRDSRASVHTTLEAEFFDVTTQPQPGSQERLVILYITCGTICHIFCCLDFIRGE